MKRRVKLHGFIIFLAILAIILFPDVLLRESRADSSDGILVILGIASVLLGQIIRLSSRGWKAEQSQSGSTLVESGPYAFVRNPMYLGILLIGLGLVLMLFKWWAIYAFLLFFTLIYIKLIFQEEKKLLLAFPGIYPAYRAKVPSIFPSFKMLVKTEISTYLPLKFSWLKREMGSILGVLIFAILVKSWSDVRGGGYILSLQRLALILLMIILASGLAAYLIKRTDASAKSI